MKEQSCLKEFIQYTTLNILGMIGMSCYILADTFFVAKGVGTNGLTALNLALPIWSAITGVGMMLGMGGATKYSIFKGQGKTKNADSVFVNVLYAAGLFMAVYVLAGLFFSRQITVLVGADAEVFEMTNTYLKVLLLFSPAFILNDTLTCFVRNDGSPKLSMYAMLLGCLANIILDYILIFPCGMGILGAVLATGSSPIISILVLSKHRKNKQNGLHFEKVPPKFRLIGECISLGIPSLVTEISSGMVILVFNILILGLAGNVGVAAYGVIANISLVVVAIYNGIAQGIQPLLARAYGSRNRKNIKQILKYAMITVLLLSMIIYFCIFFFAEPITTLFNSEGNARLQMIAEPGLKIYFTASLFVGINIVLSIYFTSMEKAVPAQLISILRGLVVIIPMAFLLAKVAGITGIWLAFPVTEFLVAVFALIVYKRMSGEFGIEKKEDV